MLYSYTQPLIEIIPDKITIEQESISTLTCLQAQTSKAIWRPAPGRKMGFVVLYAEQLLLGIVFLASPVITLGVRDQYLKLSSNPSERGKQLRNYMDMSVCVGLQPNAWHWNIGKLCALLATTLTDEVQNKYGDQFLGVITTSLFGRSSQYNRIYKFLGYTKGFGHEHISDERYRGMLNWLIENGYEVPSCKFGAGANPRMRRIQSYIKYSGEKINLEHGNKRGVYYHQAIPTNERQDTVKQWFTRWGLPRYVSTRDKEPPYRSGKE